MCRFTSVSLALSSGLALLSCIGSVIPFKYLVVQGDSRCFAAGMADGMLSVRRRKADAHLTKQEQGQKTFQFKMQKHSFKPSKVFVGEGHVAVV